MRPARAAAVDTAGWGTGALEEGARVDVARLRAQRRAAVLAAMAADDLDALVLGREANARYVSGARRLWTEGPRPFGPGCVVLAATDEIHLLSTWDDGIPAEIDHDHLYGVTWNGATLFGALAAIDGLTGARRIGVDGMSPGMGQMLGALAPGAEVVDASGLLGAVRRTKSPDELACIGTSLAIAEAALADAMASLAPGVTGRELAGRVAARLAELGVTTPDFEATFTSSSPVRGPAGRGRRGEGLSVGDDPPLRILPTPEAFGGGALVTGQVGGLYMGYEGLVARTWICPTASGDAAPTPDQQRLHRRWLGLSERLEAACRPGAAAGGLLGAYQAAGEPVPANVLVAQGVGLGMERPLVGTQVPPDAGATTTLEPGMVLYVTAAVTDRRVGTELAGQTVLVTDAGPQVLSRHSFGPLAGDAG
ncbi:MAG TPA: M24 family metallopeptidase [Acidimicrobiales bacterium]|nr:M24 family metallopeptidase [Acidimicrobiales bacterium]